MNPTPSATMTMTPPSGTSTPTPTMPPTTAPTTVILSNGYRITFLGVTTTGSISTWRYRVEELASAQDLSNWVLELAGCTVITAAPEPWEIVNPDPNAHLSGVKWQTGAGFRQGEFTVTLQDTPGITRVAVVAKCPDVAYGELAGPDCPDDTPSPSPVIVITPPAKAQRSLLCRAWPL